MSLISLAQPFHLLVSPKRTRNPIFASKFQPSFPGFSIHGHLCTRRGKVFSRSARNEEDTDESFQVSENKTAGSEDTSSSSSSFLSVFCPLLKFFGGGDPSRQRNEIIEVTTSSLSTVARLPWGSRSLNVSKHNLESIGNPPNLQLYEFEACPFCRRVREAMTELDLSAEIYPCPKGSRRHREIVRKIGGKEQFPFLVDLSNGVSMYESGDIVRYLFQQYGLGSSPSFGLLESTLFTGWVPTFLRAGRGMTLWNRAPSEPPPKMLELFSCENNPYARIVREALCELELPYILRNIGEGSLNAGSILIASVSKEVPYLVDPNTGTRIGDYKKIMSYLFHKYSAA